MIKKFIAQPDIMPEHEILEILLFDSIPRKDTNLLAHKILDVFGSLKRVLGATAEELMTVDGVGEKTASKILLMSKLAECLAVKKEQKDKEGMAYSFEKNRDFVINLLKDENEEAMLVFLFDKKDKLLTYVKFSDKDYTRVRIDEKTLTKAIVVNKPFSGIVAHNHPSGALYPSLEDDISTKKLFLILQLHGVKLLDHIIVANGNAFSFYLNGRIDEIREKFTVEKLLNDKLLLGKKENK